MSDIKSRKFYNAVKVKVEGIKLKLREVNNTDCVERVRFLTDLGDITFKPKHLQNVEEKKGAFLTEKGTSRLLTMEEFTDQNEMLIILATNCESKKQDVTLSYAEIDTYDETKDEENTYRYLSLDQFGSIYYPEFHKDNKENLDKQLSQKKRFEEKAL